MNFSYKVGYFLTYSIVSVFLKTNFPQTLRVNNSRILRIKNVKFSGYYFHKNTSILGEFQICISVLLSICVNKYSPCDLSITGDKIYQLSHDQKVMMLLTQWKNTWTTVNELFLLPKFDNSSPSETRDKPICQSHIIVG